MKIKTCVVKDKEQKISQTKHPVFDKKVLLILKLKYTINNIRTICPTRSKNPNNI